MPIITLPDGNSIEFQKKVTGLEVAESISKSLSKQAFKRWFTDDYINKNPNIYKKICSMLEENNMENFLKVYQLFVEHQDDEKFEKDLTWLDNILPDSVTLIIVDA